METIAESHFEDNRSTKNKGVFPAKYSLINRNRRIKKSTGKPKVLSYTRGHACANSKKQ